MDRSHPNEPDGARDRDRDIEPGLRGHESASEVGSTLCQCAVCQDPASPLNHIPAIPTGPAHEPERAHSLRPDQQQQQQQQQQQPLQQQPQLQQQQPLQQQQQPIRPLPAGTADRGHRYSLARRAQCLSLLAVGLSSKDVEYQSGIPPRTQRNIWNKAKARGYDPKVSPYILDSYVIDGERSGRPKAASAESPAAEASAGVDSLTADRPDKGGGSGSGGGEKASEDLAEG